jgi:hypothetical protein
MTAIEVLAQVAAEQGYLVMNAREQYEIGQIIRETAKVWLNTPNGWESSDVDQPVQVVAVSDRDEFMAQVRRIHELGGSQSNGIVVNRYFYRVVTD